MANLTFQRNGLGVKTNAEQSRESELVAAGKSGAEATAVQTLA